MIVVVSTTDPKREIEAVWRIEAPRLIAGLASITRDITLAEDLAQDALVAALETWPGDGIPENPGAWLMTTARYRGIDMIRRERNLASKYEEVGREIEARIDLTETDFTRDIEREIDDDMLRLIFTTCHPVLAPEAQAALTLRLLGGLTVAEIARAYLEPEPTVAQRITRAKKKLAKEGVGFVELPVDRAEREARMKPVLEVIYLIFNEGYAATGGDSWMRPDLAREAIRLGRVLAGIAPGEVEVHGLLALMELQASRMPARLDKDGSPVLLSDQDRSRWDRTLLRHGLASLDRALALNKPAGTYTVQAAIAACHARANTAEETDWVRIAVLYGTLRAMTGSPVVELNRAVAVTMADGPEAGLAIVEQLEESGVLDGYHPLFAVKGDILERLGRGEEAAELFNRAAELAANDAERRILVDRARAAALT